jgi:hypothetical protein
VAVEAAYQNASIEALRILLLVGEKATDLSLLMGLVAELTELSVEALFALALEHELTTRV